MNIAPAFGHQECSDIDGFSLHAAVRVEAHERKLGPCDGV